MNSVVYLIPKTKGFVMAVFKKRIHFFDADAAGVLFHGTYFNVCHSVFESYIASQNKYHEYFSSSDFGFPIIHTEATYSAPLFPGEEVEINLSLIEIKNSSFSLLYKIKKQNGDIAAEIKIVIVSIEKKKWQKIALPPFVREMLNQL